MDEVQAELVRQVRIDLRFLQRSLSALHDKDSNHQLARMLRIVEGWLDKNLLEKTYHCPACMDAPALAELNGED